MFIVGLTGGIGCGKSTVSKMLCDLGVPVIDSDYLARKVVEPGRPAWRKIRDTFGQIVLEEDGKLNRKKLGEIIFADKEKRKQLNAITHPQIAKEIFWLILDYFVKGTQFVVIDSPLLFEAGTWVRLCHKVIVVSCTSDQQIERLTKRDKFSVETALSRINAQMSDEEKCKRADFIIFNEKSIEDTEKQVSKIYCKLRSSNMQWAIRLGIVSVFASLISFISWGILSLFL